MYPIHIFSNLSDFQTPSSIWNVIQPPQQLFIQGAASSLHLLNQLPSSGLAIVGTRNPQNRSISLVRKVLDELRDSPLVIISGLARGIDTAAHWAALEIGLPTIAILGAGLDLNYPRDNSLLRQKILEKGGLIVSEFPIGAPAVAHHFLKRNRLIAGWSQATWVVEASSRSGALNTAKWAREMNKTCFAVPCFPDDPALAGNQTLLDRDHALPIWGAHNLGAVWLELATKTQGTLLNFSKMEKISTPIAALVQYVNALTFQKGGGSLDEVYDWALSQNWSSEEFFVALQSAIQKKYLVNHRGLLMKKQ